MKKIVYLLAVILLSIPVSAVAQKNNDDANRREREARAEEMRRERRDYYIEKIGLTEDEAAKFIPLLEEKSQRQFELNREVRRQARRLERSKEPVSDAEYLRCAAAFVSVEFSVDSVEQVYFEKFKTILSPQKLFKYKRAESRYTREMMNRKSKDDAPKGQVSQPSGK